jgi:mannitol-1-phosphate/altronate dehydrogenase
VFREQRLSRQSSTEAAWNVEELQQAILEFLDAWNEDPKPFVWTATVQMIQEKLGRCRQTVEQIPPGCTQPRRRRRTQKLSS